MPNRRVERINGLLRQEISALISREIKDPRLGVVVSITQVRTALWSHWSRRQPRGSRMSSVVRFKIMRDGTARGIEVEEKSGNSLFDYAALSAVRGSTPFPPLPDDFPERSLKVHVEFKRAT